MDKFKKSRVIVNLSNYSYQIISEARRAQNHIKPQSIRPLATGIIRFFMLRWVILVIYSLSNLAGGFVQVPFASCSPAVAEVRFFKSIDLRHQRRCCRAYDGSLHHSLHPS